MGISDSVQNILYVICSKGNQCLQSEISKLTGISRQTIHSALHKLEKDGIVRIEAGQGRNTIVRLTEAGKAFAQEKVYPLFEERQNYLKLTQKYRDALKRHLQAILQSTSQRKETLK